MSQAKKAKCTNTLTCDLALKGELIDVPQDGRCPSCGKPLEIETVKQTNLEDDVKIRRTILFIAAGIALIALCLAAYKIVDRNEDKDRKPSEPPASIPITPVPTPTSPAVYKPSLDSQQHLKQGILFVSMAKVNSSTRSENLNNAINEFTLAINAEEEQQHQCYANAYMNRGVAYWQDNKHNLAEQDLIKASECDSKDPFIFYNLASYYSAFDKADLAIAPLDKALELGFDNCSALRNDKDLKKLRAMPEFRAILEKHKLPCL